MALLLSVAVSEAAAQEALPITPAGDSTFPVRAFRFTVPEGQTLDSAGLKVTENGNPVDKLLIRSGNDVGPAAFGVVLVIDASASMKGAPIRGAMAAARTLAAQRLAAQKLGVVVFNGAPRVLLEPTTDGRAIDRALAVAPKLAPQTHIFDAVDSALRMLTLAKVSAGSIVVLSDGADTGSTVSGAIAARRARRDNVQVFTVGLKSGVTNERELRQLAVAGRGRYTPAASAGELTKIFRQLGAELAGSSLITYRSFAEPGSEVTVAVRFPGRSGVATSSYVVPGGASFVQVEDTFWTSNTALIIVASLCALVLAAGLGHVLLQRLEIPSISDRVRGFTAAHDEDLVAERQAAAWIRPDTRGGFGNSPRWLAFVDDVEIARIETSAGRIANLTAVATLVVTLLLILITGFVGAGLLGLGVPFGVRGVIRLRRDRERQKFAEQLPDLLQGTASAVRAGQGLVAALALISEDAPEPCRREFQRAVGDEALGVPIEVALRTVQVRMDSRAIIQLALVAEIQRDAGGNMAEVLDRITESLRQAAELRRMVAALTAQGRLSRWVVSAIPVGLLLVVSVLAPDYISPLFTEAGGLALLAAGGTMVVVGSLVIGKIVDFEI